MSNMCETRSLAHQAYKLYYVDNLNPLMIASKLKVPFLEVREAMKAWPDIAVGYRKCRIKGEA